MAGEDAAALDEAQRALHEASCRVSDVLTWSPLGAGREDGAEVLGGDGSSTQSACGQVARENRKLREDLSALEDEGFWQEGIWPRFLRSRRASDRTGLVRHKSHTRCSSTGDRKPSAPE